MKCTNCGNELKLGQKFCTKCGTPVAAVAPATESKTIGATCTNCGNVLKTEQKFCTKCGTPVAVTEANSANQQVGGIQCPSCGKILKPGQKFCTGCGAPAPLAENGEKGIMSRIGAGIASAATGGSFSQGYAQQREREQEYSTLRDTAEYAIKNARSTMKTLLKEHKDIITYDDEVKVNELIAKVEKALAGNNAEHGDRNSAIKKAINALENEIARLRVKAEDGGIRQTGTQQTGVQQERITTRQTARGYQLSEYNEAELNVVQNKAIWGIQPGEIARRITERELDSVVGLDGFIIQEGCQAMIFVNGNLVAAMDAGAYNVPERSQQLMKQEFEKLYAEMEQQDKEKRAAAGSKPQTIRERGGVFGVAGSYLRRGWEFLFGATPAKKEKNDKANEERVRRLKAEVEKALKVKNPEPVMSVIIVSKRNITLSFGGTATKEGIQFTAYTIPIGIWDVQMGTMLQLKVNDISRFATNYLADKNSCTSNDFFNMLNSTIENCLRENLRNLDYSREGLANATVEMLKEQIKSIINQQLHGIECVHVLQITDRDEDFDRFRKIEKELYCTEKELDYLQRTGEFRNRLAIETNKQKIQEATNEEDLRYALQQINKDQMLHDDELEQFVLFLNAQKRIREAKSDEDERQAYIDLKKSGLIKDEELVVLQDALEQNKIQRESITEIMRIQNNQSVSDARLRAEWALDDMKEDHDWEREDLDRRRNWGIEDEEREREWQIEDARLRRDMEQEMSQAEHENRMTDVELENARKRDDYREQKEDREWEKEFEREQRQNDADWNEEQRRRATDWEYKERERQMRREDEETAYNRSRQDKLDDRNTAMENMQMMLEDDQRKREHELKQQEIELRRQQEANRSAENMHSMNVHAQMNKDNVEATMSAEALMAKQAAQLGIEGQVALAQALGSGKENEMLQKQQAEQAALYQQMLQMQQAQGNQTQEAMMQNQQMMMQMAQMMQQGMLNMGQNNAANQQAMFNQQQQFQQAMFNQQQQHQQERYDDQKARADEYKQDSYRQQDRMDAASQQALDFSTRSHQTDSQSFAQAMGGVPQNFQSQPQYQQPAQQQPATKAGNTCPNCGMPVEPGDMICGECGNRLR